MYFSSSTLIAISELLPILSPTVRNMNELNRTSKRQHFTVLLGTGKGAENSLRMCVSEHRRPLEGSVAPKAAISNLRPTVGLHASIDGTAQKCSNTNCSLQINQSTWIFIFLVISELIFFPSSPSSAHWYPADHTYWVTREPISHWTNIRTIDYPPCLLPHMHFC